MIIQPLAAQAPYFVEIIGRHGELKARHRFEHLPISIGRSYTNDVILDEAEVDSFHAIVEATAAGTLNIRESGSRQGVVYRGKRISSLEVDGHAVVQLGHAHVRVRSADFIVKDEVTHQSTPQKSGFMLVLVGLLVLMLSSLVNVWLSDTGQFSMTNQLFSIAGLLAVVTIWSGVWAFAGRVIGGAARFGRHFMIVSCGLVLIDIWAGISALLAYAFSLEFLTAYGNHVVVAIVVVMVFYHLSNISEQHPKRYVWVCATLMVIGSGLLLLSNYQRNGNLADTLYMKHLLPPSVRLTTNQPAEQFMQEAQALKGPIDKARLEDVDDNASVD